MFTTLNVRVILWATLVMALFMNYVQWVNDYAPPPAAAGVAGAANANPNNGLVPLGSTVPMAAPAAATSAPAVTAAAVPAGAAPVATGPVMEPGAAPAATPAATTGTARLASANTGSDAPRVHVVTDVLDLDISLDGGELVRADLPKYPQVKGEPAPVRLLNRGPGGELFTLQSGLSGVGGSTAPTHLTRLSTTVSELRLGPDQDELRLPLTWSNGAGVTVTKTYIFHRDQYAIGLDYQLQNASSTPWSFSPYLQLLRDNTPVATSYFHPESYAYKGPAYDDGHKYQKLKPASTPPTLNAEVDGGWLAAMQHHFVAAVVPTAGAPWHYQLDWQGQSYLLSATGSAQQLAGGASATLHQTLFVGPKLQAQLGKASPRLYLVTDYGWLSVVARPLFWLLDNVHKVFGNWGWTIMVVTLLLKLLFYPLSEASMKSMARMKALQPRIKLLQETYKDQRDKLSKAMMELYQKEKVNPVAGCLPMLIQFPVFIAFYWVLLETVEMRQAPFAGWIGDLSARDPWFILPVLMAGANYINFHLNPQMGDPTQQKMFMIMQVAMPVMFAFMPSGLVLYWVTNTVLSILQQWNINRRIAAQGASRS